MIIGNGIFGGTSVFDCNHDYVGRGQPPLYENILSLDSFTVKINLEYLEILDENNNTIKQFTDKTSPSHNINIYPLSNHNYQ